MSTLENARQFFLNDARLLERHLFYHLFEGGPRGTALRSLPTVCPLRARRCAS